MNWWYSRDGQPVGPVTEADLLAVVAQGNLNFEMLVWRDGWPQWIPVRHVQSLVAQLPPEPSSTPPPLPSAGLQRQVQSSETLAKLSSPDAPNLATGVIPNDKNGQVSLVDANPVTAKWYRFFARQIDMCLIALPTVFIVSLAITILGPPTFSFMIHDTATATLYTIAILCIIAPLFEAITVAVFGSTPGKALFGLKVHSLDGAPITFGAQIKRAYKVMMYGLGFYIPFISLLTGISQYDQLKKTGTAGYDINLFRVSERSLSRPRKLVAVGTWLLSFLALIGLQVFEKYDYNRTSISKSWTNPATFLSATIPGGWEINSETNAQGQAIHVFTRAADTVQVVFAAEEVPSNATLEAYIAAFVRSVSSKMIIQPAGEETAIANHLARVHSGELLPSRTPLEVTFVKHGNMVWRTVIIDHNSTSPKISSEELRTAVFKSVPLK